MAEAFSVTAISAAPMKSSLGGLRMFTAPVNGPIRASLVFRVGWANETLADHGISHLIEHLVLAPLGRPAFAWNGSTDAERVMFWCEGTEEQVSWFLEAVAANIRLLPLQHLEMEKNLIRAEACHRSGGVVGMHDLWRWGTAGHGLGIYDELGLDHLTPERARAWADRYLTAENAVLWTTAARLTPVELPHGPAEAVVDPGDWRASPTPSWFTIDSPRVALSAELLYGHWAGVVGGLLVRRLLERLRYAEGISYSADFDVAAVGDDRRRLLVTVDGLPDRMQDIATGAAEVLRELAAAGPTAQELAEIVDTWSRQRERDTWVLAELSRLADDFLVGRPSQSPEELEDQLRALTPEQVSGFVGAMLPTILWSVPPGVVVPDCSPAPIWSQHRVTGVRWTPPRGQLQTSFVELSDEGITWVSEGVDGGCVTVLWQDCTAVIGYDDGTRRVVGKDGMSVLLFPERWDRWDQLRAAVDSRVPAGCWAPQRRAPERDAPQPTLVEVPRTSDGSWITVGLAWITLMGLLAVGSQAEGFDPVSLATLILVASVGAVPLWHVRRRRARRTAGLEPVRVSRYTGVASWPTRYVVAGLSLSVPAAGAFWLAGAWIFAVVLTGIAVRAVKELHRRAQRGALSN